VSARSDEAALASIGASANYACRLSAPKSLGSPKSLSATASRI
jgi:hypothetical protein